MAHKRLTVTTLLLALVLVAWVAADATWTLFAPDYQLPAATSAVVLGTPGVKDYGKSISEAHLLGEPERRPVRRQVPVTRLELELLGVYHSGAGEGFAFIREQGGEQKLYRRGAAVSGNATLREVKADHVVLDVGGRLESLYLDKDEGPDGLTGVSQVSEDAPVGARLAALRRRAIADPISLGKMIEATPVRQGGRMRGFQIRQRSDDPLFRDVGLKDGDVLVEINGIRLDQPSKGFEALQELANAREVTARVERAGRSFTIRQPLE